MDAFGSFREINYSKLNSISFFRWFHPHINLRSDIWQASLLSGLWKATGVLISNTYHGLTQIWALGGEREVLKPSGSVHDSETRGINILVFDLLVFSLSEESQEKSASFSN